MVLHRPIEFTNAIATLLIEAGGGSPSRLQGFDFAAN
jgi:hypothetical protein